MSSLIHCDNPDCIKTTEEAMGSWFTVDRRYQTLGEIWPKHFCSLDCMRDICPLPKFANANDLLTQAHESGTVYVQRRKAHLMTDHECDNCMGVDPTSCFNYQETVPVPVSLLRALQDEHDNPGSLFADSIAALVSLIPKPKWPNDLVRIVENQMIPIADGYYGEDLPSVAANILDTIVAHGWTVRGPVTSKEVVGIGSKWVLADDDVRDALRGLGLSMEDDR